MHIIRRGLRLACTILGLTLASVAAGAQDFPTKPITLIVPFAAGGPTDVAGRLIGQRMAEILGQPLVIENRAGAGGRTGVEAVARAAPDGYTLGVANSATQAIIPITNAKIGYDPLVSFVNFGFVGTYPLILVCNPKLPAQNLKELIALMKSRPGMSHGGPGGGGQSHLLIEYFKVKAGVDVRHVAYRGTGPVQADVISGAIDCAFDGGARELIESGKVRAMASSRAKRDAIYPNIPTMEEEGFKPFDLFVWMALIGPAGIPESVIKRITAAFDTAKADKQVVDKLVAFGVGPGLGDGAEQTAVTKRDLDTYRKIVTDANLKFE